MKWRYAVAVIGIGLVVSGIIAQEKKSTGGAGGSWHDEVPRLLAKRHHQEADRILESVRGLDRSWDWFLLKSIALTQAAPQIDDTAAMSVSRKAARELFAEAFARYPRSSRLPIQAAVTWAALGEPEIARAELEHTRRVASENVRDGVGVADEERAVIAHADSLERIISQARKK